MSSIEWVTISARGEVVIPKKARQKLGMHGRVRFEMRDKEVAFIPAQDDVVERFEAIANEVNLKASDIVMGDELYGEVFDVSRLKRLHLR